MKRRRVFLLAACVLLTVLPTACTENKPQATDPKTTLPAVQTDAAPERAETTDGVQSDTAKPSAATAPTQAKAGPVEPVSGKYCALGVYGRTYPEYTALKFDFENNRFNFGFPTLNSSWDRKGELMVESSRITAVSDAPKSYSVENEQIVFTYYIWIFELEPDGSLRFIPEGSDTFELYGTQLNADSVLLRVGELDKPLERPGPIPDRP